MRARFGKRLPAVLAGLLILAVAAGVLQTVAGTSSANAPRGGAAVATIASAGGAGRPATRRVAKIALRPAGCRPTTATAASAAGRHAARPRFVVRHHAALALAGRLVAIRGQLQDACAGVRVQLQQRRGHGWTELRSARVSRHGRFELGYRAPEVGTAGLRVAFDGGHGLKAATASAGDITSMHPAVASWYYDDTGATGCGFQAEYGVANKTLPCGTKVTLSYGGRTVVATVDDRGPYVAGRTYDLGINTRNALGMTGVVTLLASY